MRAIVLSGAARSSPSLAHPCFKKELNREALPQYLCFEYMNDSQTMFKTSIR